MEYEKGSGVRKSQYPIDNIFLDRWSPRAMSGEPIVSEELMTLFEAARWAPSAFNEQPWRFIYATRDSPHWEKFFNLLMEGNQTWCKNAAALVCIVSRKTFSRNDKPHVTHMFSTGSAYQNLALQGTKMGLVVHGMSGFFYDKAQTELNIPGDYEVNMMFAVGKPGNPENLPEQVRAGEKPSERKPVSEIVFEGEFKE